MPRTKPAKRVASPSSSNALALTNKMEKDLIGTPAKLAAQLSKEISSLKQKESKLKIASNKMKAQIKKWDASIKASAKSKTASAKKQLQKAKKAQQRDSKEYASLAAELKATSQMLEATMGKQAKFMALAKTLNQFDKDWAKRAKKTKIAKVGGKTKTKSRKKKSLEQAASAPQQESNRETMLMSEDVSFNETEITS